MALSRERIADELTQAARACPTRPRPSRLMVERGILRPVLPEIGAGRRRTAGAAGPARGARPESAPHPLRRLAALLPPDPEVAAAVAARLRLSNRAAQAAGVGGRGRRDPAKRRELLAYRIGAEEAVDRILLGDGDPARDGGARAAGSGRGFAVGGGDLIAMGLEAGPGGGADPAGDRARMGRGRLSRRKGGAAGDRPAPCRSGAARRASRRRPRPAASGRAKWKPWPCVQPSSASAWASSGASIPSAVVSMPSALASDRMARTIATESRSREHAGDEAAVDLEHVDRQALEVGERGVAGAEIVHRDADVERLQSLRAPWWRAPDPG